MRSRRPEAMSALPCTPEGGHVEAWQNAYSDPDLWEWLARQRQAK